LTAKCVEEYMSVEFITRQAMQVSRYIEVRQPNHCCRGKAISITYSECVSVALGIGACNAHAPYYIVVCGLSGCNIFFLFSTLSHKRQDFRHKKSY